MTVVDDLKSATIDGKVRESVELDSTITSDEPTFYTNFGSIVKEHIHQAIEPHQVGKELPWVHIAIGNAKRLLLNVYHQSQSTYRTT